jgi:3-hydroxybutyrate dehydrogenase
MPESRVVIVTGGTSGIGKAIALAFAKIGHKVAINGFGTHQDIDSVLAELTAAGADQVLHVPSDMTKTDEIQKLMESVERKLGACQILVNNAGIQHTARIEDFPADKWDQIISINLSAAFHTMRLALPAMQKNNFGRILNIASVHGLVASVDKSAYVAAKHGIIGLTKVAALENANYNITANCVCPGWVKTPLVEKQVEAIALRENLSMETATEKLLSEKQPSGRFVPLEELAALCVFLSGDNASSITGMSLPVDGGWTAR